MINSGQFHLEVQALLVQQRPPEHITSEEFINEYDFFVFEMPSDELLKIAKFSPRSESPRGIQRAHKEDRDREIGRFITSDHPFFPNTIIINIPLQFNKDYYNTEIKSLTVDIPLKEAYVIDGQHRLRAFASKYSKGVSLNLVVSAYFGLELPTIAEIFTRINFFQKPVSKSLVYDLLDLSNDPEFQKYKEAHEIVNILHTKIGSPWYDLIKLLGVGKGLLSQAAFVEACSTRYKILELLKELPSTADKARILEGYFAAIRDYFPQKWGNPDSVLTRTLGFNALMKSLQVILQRGKLDVVSTDGNFAKYVEAIRSIDVDAEDIRRLGGYGGVNELARRFVTAIDEKGLLR